MVRVHSVPHAVKAVHVEIDETGSDDAIFGRKDVLRTRLRDFFPEFQNLAAADSDVYGPMQFLRGIDHRSALNEQVNILARVSCASSRCPAGDTEFLGDKNGRPSRHSEQFCEFTAREHEGLSRS